MPKKCIRCGYENDDSAVRCVCGTDLPAEAANAPAVTPTAAAASQEHSPSKERSLLVRKLLFVAWTIGFVPIFAALRSHGHLSPLYRSLLGTSVFCAPAVAALWVLGREQQRTLRTWRVVFLLWMVFLTPVLLTIVDGIAEEGWPRGRFNRLIANVLVMILTMTVPAFLTSLCALLRAYRLASVLASLAGLSAVADGILLLRASWHFSMRAQRLTSVLDIIGFGSKLESYVAIPVGIALVIGGIMTWRAARAARLAAQAAP